MKIVVAIKQVPLRDSPLRLNSTGTWIEEENLSFEINEPDAYALEEALQLREKHGGEVIVISAGPARVAQTLREALAKGADRGIHILTGLQSDDLGYGQTGVILAELLGLPNSTIIMQVEIQPGKVRVKRELEDGWFQHIEMPLPAVLTIQSGLNKLRYATLMGIKKAKSKEIKVIAASDVPPASAVIEKLYAPEKNKQGQIFDGDPKAAAAKLVEKLRFEARVI
jgi:electron transfer flavoprotein beta subunit